MQKPKLRRSIYIGLGGTGSDAIEVVKNYFMATTKRIPAMIKFLAIDTNQQELARKGFDSSEQLPLMLSKPKAVYNNNIQKYSWIPKKNVENLQGIGSNGAGQIRSNGAFILAVKESAGQESSFSETLSSIRDRLVSITAEDPDYDLLSTPKIDVHLCFSLCGGTGSGMFLEIAKLIKKVIPNSNLIGYALSNSFYDNVGVHHNVKSNAYAALVELDYCMHAHRLDYENSDYEIVSEKPFDAVMYIDKSTYTRNETETEYKYDRDEVLSSIGYAMVLSAGNLGDDAKSIIDNLNGVINSGGYDIDCRNGKKSAWISSLGVSEIYCKKNSSLDLFSHNLAIQELGLLKEGSTAGAEETAKEWIKQLKINEGGPDDPGDHDELINRMISPAKIQLIGNPNSIIVDDNGTVNDSMFIRNIPIKEEELEKTVKIETEKTKNELFGLINKILFPSQGQKTCGLSHLESILNTIVNSGIEKYRKRLNLEITSYQNEIEKINNDELSSVQTLRNQLQHLPILRNQNIINISKNSIKQGRCDKLKKEKEIQRREMAIKLYDAIEEKIKEYTNAITRLQNVLQDAITSLSEEVGKFVIPEKLEERSTSVDVSSLISELPESHINDCCIKDWNDFRLHTQKPTLSELADMKDWKEFVLDYVKLLYPIQSSQPIIKIMKLLQEKQVLNHRIKDILNRARPLMDISSYGKEEELKPTEFVIVSLPDAADAETKFIRDAFNAEYKGPNAIQFVSLKDSNRIVVYRQLGVIPPYYIKGISSGKNGVINPFSCEEAFNSLRNGSDNYSPFTKITYEKAVKNGGHTLDSLLGAISESDIMEMWVTGFVLGLISRDQFGCYRIKSDEGEIDMDDELLKSYISLGKTRKEAYMAFENLKESIKKEFSRDLTESLRDHKARIAFDEFLKSDDAMTRYKKEFSLISDEEYQNEKYELQKELNYIKARR